MGLIAGLEIYDSIGQIIYDTISQKSIYKIGSFTLQSSLYPGGSEGNGAIQTVLTDPSIVPGSVILSKTNSVPTIGYSYGHYPAHAADGDGYIDITIHSGYITAQFKRKPAHGTKGYYFIFSMGSYDVWGLKK